MALGDISKSQMIREEIESKHSVRSENTLEYKFCTGTSCHGLKNMAEAKRAWVRWFWGLAVLIAFGLLLEQIIVLSVDYASHGTVTNVYVNRTRGLSFPSITICNYNRFRKDKLSTVSEKYGTNPEHLWTYLHYAFELFNNTRVSPKTSFDVETIIRQVHLNVTQTNGFKLYDILEEVGGSLEDLIPLQHCFWYGYNPRPCTADMFTPVMTVYGKCWSFNFQAGHDSDFRQVFPGSSTGLGLLLNVGQDQGSEHYSIGNAQTGVKVMIHSPDSSPSFVTSTTAVPPGVFAYLAMESLREIRQKPPWGDCGSRPLPNTNIYTQDMCSTNTILQYIKKECKCAPISLLGTSDESLCQPPEMLSCVPKAVDRLWQHNAEQNFDCPPICDEMLFDSDVSYAQLGNEYILPSMGPVLGDTLGRNLTQEHIRKNLIELDVFFKNLATTVSEQKPAKIFESLIADIGGQLGLFIGASVITLSEFVEYFIVKLSLIIRYYAGRERRQEKQRNTTTVPAVMEAKDIKKSQDEESALKGNDREF